MSVKEKTKIMLDLYKSLILTFLTASFTIFGYTVVNHKDLDKIKIIGICVGSIILLVAIIFLLVVFFKNVKKIEKED